MFDWKQFFEEAVRIAACDTMPEMREYSAIMKGIYENYLKATAVAAEKTMFKSVGPIYIMERS